MRYCYKYTFENHGAEWLGLDIWWFHSLEARLPWLLAVYAFFIMVWNLELTLSPVQNYKTEDSKLQKVYEIIKVTKLNKNKNQCISPLLPLIQLADAGL